MERDLAEVETKRKTKPNEKIGKRGRDPGIAWILDFNNDGIVSYDESDSADTLIDKDPQRLPIFSKDEL
jgi:hypothetical protein